MKTLIKAFIALQILFGLGTFAYADYPERPIRVVTFAAPGGAVDIILRRLQSSLQDILGQPLVIDNKPGAGGLLAMKLVASAKPDGYTIGYVVNGMVTGAIVQKQEDSISLERDFSPISLVGEAPQILYTNPKVPGTTVREFLDWAKAQPNPVPYGSTGVGLIGHTITELLSSKTGVKFLHVPYSGHAPSMVALMAGDVMFTITSYSDLGIENVKVGKLKILGITTANRQAFLPGIPAISETVPGFDASTWVGLVAPKGTPPAIIEKLNKALRDVMKDPDIQKTYMANGYAIAPSSPEEMHTKIVKERALWEPFLRQANLAN